MLYNQVLGANIDPWYLQFFTHPFCHDCVAKAIDKEVPKVQESSADPKLLAICDAHIDPESIQALIFSILTKAEDALRSAHCYQGTALAPPIFMHRHPIKSSDELYTTLKSLPIMALRKHQILGAWLDTVLQKGWQLVAMAGSRCQLDYRLVMKIVRMGTKMMQNCMVCDRIAWKKERKRLEEQTASTNLKATTSRQRCQKCNQLLKKLMLSTPRPSSVYQPHTVPPIISSPPPLVPLGSPVSPSNTIHPWNNALLPKPQPNPPVNPLLNPLLNPMLNPPLNKPTYPLPIIHPWTKSTKEVPVFDERGDLVAWRRVPISQGNCLRKPFEPCCKGCKCWKTRLHPGCHLCNCCKTMRSSMKPNLVVSGASLTPASSGPFPTIHPYSLPTPPTSPPKMEPYSPPPPPLPPIAPSPNNNPYSPSLPPIAPSPSIHPYSPPPTPQTSPFVPPPGMSRAAIYRHCRRLWKNYPQCVHKGSINDMPCTKCYNWRQHCHQLKMPTKPSAISTPPTPIIHPLNLEKLSPSDQSTLRSLLVKLGLSPMSKIQPNGMLPDRPLPSCQRCNGRGCGKCSMLKRPPRAISPPSMSPMTIISNRNMLTPMSHYDPMQQRPPAKVDYPENVPTMASPIIHPYSTTPVGKNIPNNMPTLPILSPLYLRPPYTGCSKRSIAPWQVRYSKMGPFGQGQQLRRTWLRSNLFTKKCRGMAPKKYCVHQSGMGGNISQPYPIVPSLSSTSQLSQPLTFPGSTSHAGQTPATPAIHPYTNPQIPSSPPPNPPSLLIPSQSPSPLTSSAGDSTAHSGSSDKETPCMHSKEALGHYRPMQGTVLDEGI